MPRAARCTYAAQKDPYRILNEPTNQSSNYVGRTLRPEDVVWAAKKGRRAESQEEEVIRVCKGGQRTGTSWEVFFAFVAVPGDRPRQIPPQVNGNLKDAPVGTLLAYRRRCRTPELHRRSTRSQKATDWKERLTKGDLLPFNYRIRTNECRFGWSPCAREVQVSGSWREPRTEAVLRVRRGSDERSPDGGGSCA